MFLCQAKQLIWHDTDKKGRPRERDCRPNLQSIRLKNYLQKEKEPLRLNKASIELKALIDPMGRSLKPSQIKHWIEERMGYALEISDVRRNELQLLQQC